MQFAAAVDAPRTAEEFSFCEVLQVYDSSTCPRLSSLASHVRAPMTSRIPPYASVLHRRAHARIGTLSAADAPSQVAIATKAGPTDPLSLTIEPTRFPNADTAASRGRCRCSANPSRPAPIEVLYWSPDVSFDGNSIPRGVLVANGAASGTDAVPHGGAARRRTQRSRDRASRVVRDRSDAPQRSRYRRADRQPRRLPPRHALSARPARSQSLLPRKANKAARPRASRTRCSKTSSSPATISSTFTPVRSTAPTSRRCAAT